MYIERRYRKFYACHDIPTDVQRALGEPGKPRRRFVKSLATTDPETALTRAAMLEAQWRAAIARARGAPEASMEEHAAFYRRALQASASPAERAMIMDRLTDEAMDLSMDIDGVPHSHAEPGEKAEEREGYQAGLRFIQLATGELVKLGEHLEEYLATLRCEPKTRDMKRSIITKFCEAGFTYAADVNRKAVQQWVNRQALAAATVQRNVSDLRGYWQYLISIEAAPEDSQPFEKLAMPKDGNGREDERKHFTAADVLKLLAEAKAREDVELADLIELGMWTGARREELCALKVERVNLKAGYIEIADAKTPAGWRQVPIHSKLAPTLRRLLKASTDGYVLSGLSANKYDNRGNAIGKRFGHMKQSLGFGEQHVFHSVRKTVATLLEDAGVPENVSADILGHEKPTMTYGLYSGGTSLKTKRAAIEKLDYRGDRKPRAMAQP